MSLRSTIRRKANAYLARLRRPPSSGRVLLYHQVRDHPDPIESVAPRLFQAQLEWLARTGLAGAPLRSCVERGFPRGITGVSFDDGYASTAWACEAVLARGWSATVFVVPAWIDAARHDVLGWHDLARLAAAGIEIASHGLAHERMCGRAFPSMTSELAASRARIEDRLGVSVVGLAYPYGLAPRPAREAARLAGFAYACTSVPGRNSGGTDRLALRRNEILATDATPTLFLGKLGGTDDWMAPLRRLENWWRCRA